MRYTVRKSVIQILGKIWMPYGAVCAQEQVLSDYDLGKAADEQGNHTRESVERWLFCNAGDFSEIADFYTSLEVGDKTVEIPWESEENEMEFCDCMYPAE